MAANKKLLDFVRRKGHTDENKLLNYQGMSAELGIAERTLRDWAFKRKVPALRVGHRTVLFQPDKVRAALTKFEIPAAEPAPRLKQMTLNL
jgi:hypothetical protein